MKRVAFAILALLCASSISLARQAPADSPATKEDVQKYLEVMHSKEMVAKMMDAMMKPMHEMLHQQFEKDKDRLPPDFEARMNKVLDNYLKDFPWDEVLQSMVPVYQKHFTKGDLDQLTAFYSSPVGQKVLRELPAITSESMQTMMPTLQARIETMTRQMQEEIEAMLKESEAKPAQKAQPIKN